MIKALLRKLSLALYGWSSSWLGLEAINQTIDLRCFYLAEKLIDEGVEKWGNDEPEFCIIRAYHSRESLLHEIKQNETN